VASSRARAIVAGLVPQHPPLPCHMPHTKSLSPEHWHATFLELLPVINNHASVAFRGEPPERLQDLTAEVITNCWAAFVPLMDRGLNDVSYAILLGEVSSLCAAKF
jgi:hypothetical protein